MGFNIDTTGGVKEGSGGTFAPLPAGKYQVNVFDTKPGAFGNKSANADRPNVNVQFKVADGQKGANRRIFQTVGLFLNWAATAKNPDGADNFLFYQFFGAVTGQKDKDFRAKVKEVGLEKLSTLLPDPDEILGKQVTLDLGIELDDYAYKKALADDPTVKPEDFKRNNIKSISPAGEVDYGFAEGNGDLDGDTTTSVVL